MAADFLVAVGATNTKVTQRKRSNITCVHAYTHKCIWQKKTSISLVLPSAARHTESPLLSSIPNMYYRTTIRQHADFKNIFMKVHETEWEHKIILVGAAQIKEMFLASRLVLKSRCVFKRSKVLLLKTLQLFRTSLERLSPKSNFFICGAQTNIIFCSHFVLWAFRYFVPIHCNVPIKTINAFRSNQFKKWEWQHQKRRIWYKALVPSHQRKWQFENKFRNPYCF